MSSELAKHDCPHPGAFLYREILCLSFDVLQWRSPRFVFIHLGLLWTELQLKRTKFSPKSATEQILLFGVARKVRADSNVTSSSNSFVHNTIYRIWLFFLQAFFVVLVWSPIILPLFSFYVLFAICRPLLFPFSLLLICPRNSIAPSFLRCSCCSFTPTLLVHLNSLASLAGWLAELFWLFCFSSTDE